MMSKLICSECDAEIKHGKPVYSVDGFIYKCCSAGCLAWRMLNVKMEARDYIAKQIEALQNATTATEVTERADYFVNILAENERLKRQLENSVVLPCNISELVAITTIGDKVIVKTKCKTYIKEINALLWYELETKQAAEARLKELQGDK